MGKARKRRPSSGYVEPPKDLDAEQLQSVLSKPHDRLLQQPQKGAYNPAEITLELLNNATRQAIQRHGWFRLSSFLQSKITDFKENHKLYVKAKKSIAYDGGHSIEKATHAEIVEYSDALVAAVKKAQAWGKERPMNHKRLLTRKKAEVKAPKITTTIKAGLKKKKSKIKVKGASNHKKDKEGDTTMDM